MASLDLALGDCSDTLGDRLLLFEPLRLLEHTALRRRAALDHRHFRAAACGSRLHSDDDLAAAIQPLLLLSRADGGWARGAAPISASHGIAQVTGERIRGTAGQPRAPRDELNLTRWRCLKEPEFATAIAEARIRPITHDTEGRGNGVSCAGEWPVARTR